MSRVTENLKIEHAVCLSPFALGGPDPVGAFGGVTSGTWCPQMKVPLLQGGIGQTHPVICLNPVTFLYVYVSCTYYMTHECVLCTYIHGYAWV